MLTLFYFLVVEQVLQGFYNLWDGLRWLRMAQRRIGSHTGFYAPRVALICPIKGVEPGLEQNLVALTSFDYPDYDIFFSMANSEDPARKILDKLAVSIKRKVHIVIAVRPQECVEKVNNLRASVQQAKQGEDVLVFWDSAERRGSSWLLHVFVSLAHTT